MLPNRFTRTAARVVLASYITQLFAPVAQACQTETLRFNESGMGRHISEVQSLQREAAIQRPLKKTLKSHADIVPGSIKIVFEKEEPSLTSHSAQPSYCLKLMSETNDGRYTQEIFNRVLGTYGNSATKFNTFGWSMNNFKIQVDSSGTLLQVFSTLKDNEFTISFDRQGTATFQKLKSKNYHIDLQTFGSILTSQSIKSHKLSLKGTSFHNNNNFLVDYLDLTLGTQESPGIFTNIQSAKFCIGKEAHVHVGHVENQGRIMGYDGSFLNLHGNNFTNKYLGQNLKLKQNPKKPSMPGVYWEGEFSILNGGLIQNECYIWSLPIKAGSKLRIDARNLINRNEIKSHGGLTLDILSNFRNDGLIWGNRSKVTVQGKTQNKGIIDSRYLSLITRGLQNWKDIKIRKEGQIHELEGGLGLVNSENATITSEGILDIQGNSLINRGNALSRGTIKAQTLSTQLTTFKNKGTLFAEESREIQALFLKNRASGTMTFTREGILSVGKFVNKGDVEGQILQVNAYLLENYKRIYGQLDLSLTINDLFTNTAGALASAQRELNLGGTGKLHNDKDARIESGGQFTSRIAEVENQGTVKASLEVSFANLARAFRNEGYIRSDQGVSITSLSTLFNGGEIGIIEGRSGPVTLTAEEIVNHHLMSALEGSLSLIMNWGENTYILYGGKGVTLTIRELFTNNLRGEGEAKLGLIETLQTITVQGAGELRNLAFLRAGEDITITTHWENHNRIDASRNVVVTTPLKTFINGAAGEIAAGRTATFNNTLLWQNKGQVQGQDVSLTTSSVFTNEGTVEATTGTATLDVQAGANRGSVRGENKVDLTIRQKFENKGKIVSPHNVDFHGLGLLANAPTGEVSANEQLHLWEIQLVNEGRLSSEQLFDLHHLQGTLENKVGATVFSRGKLQLRDTSTLKNEGRVEGNQQIEILVPSLENRGTIISKEGTIELTADQTTNTENASISGKKDVTLKVSQYLQNQGDINSGKAVTVEGLKLSNAGLIHGIDRAAIDLKTVDNKGEISSETALVLTVWDLVNRGILEANQKTILTIGNTGTNHQTLKTKGLEIRGNRFENLSPEAITTVELDAKLKELRNTGSLISEKGKITVETLENEKMISVAGDSMFTVDNLYNHGEIESHQQVSLRTGMNTGKIYGQSLVLDVQQSLTSEGEVVLKDLVGTGRFINKGKLELTGGAEAASQINIQEFENGANLENTAVITPPMNTSPKAQITGSHVVVTPTNEKFITHSNSEIVAKSVIFARGLTRSARRPSSTTPLEIKGTIHTTEALEIYRQEILNFGILETLSFSIHGGKFGNSPNALLHVGRSIEADVTSFQNDGKMIVDRGKFTQKTGEFTNTGRWEHVGDIDLGATTLQNNKGTLVWKNGRWDFAFRQFFNLGDWSFDRMSCSHPLSVHNRGTLNFKNNAITFQQLINHKNLIFSSGQYAMTGGLQNNGLMSFLEYDWTFTDDAASTAPNRLILKDNAVKGYVSPGEVESEQDLVYDVQAFPKAIRSKGDITFSPRHRQGRTINDLPKVTTPGRVSFYVPATTTTQDYEFTIGHLALYIDGLFTTHHSFKAPALALDVNGPLTCGASNSVMGTIAGTNGYRLVLMSDLPANKMPVQRKMYLEKSEGKLKYTVIAPDGKPVEGILNIQVDGELTPQILKQLEPQILEETLQIGHTQMTSGSLTVTAHSIDGRFGKFYGAGPTHIQSTKGDILVGAAKQGVDPEFKQNYLANCNRFVRVTGKTFWASFESASSRNRVDRSVEIIAQATASYMLDQHAYGALNEAYLSSQDTLTLVAANDIVIDCGIVFGGQGSSLTAEKNIRNIAGKILSLGKTRIQCGEYIHSAKPHSTHQLSGSPAKVFVHERGSYYIPTMQLPNSGPALLNSLGHIEFYVNSIINFASAIYTGGSLFMNGALSVKKSGKEYLPNYTEGNLSLFYKYFNAYGLTTDWGEKTVLAFTQYPLLLSAQSMNINANNCIFVGTINAPTVVIQANGNILIQGNNGRSILVPAQTVLFNYMQYIQSYVARNKGLTTITADGEVNTEFPLGTPHVGKTKIPVLVRSGSHHPFQRSMNPLPVFNPLRNLSSGFLNFFMQSALSELIGKVHLTDGGNRELLSILENNAVEHCEETKSDVITLEQTKSLKKAMILHEFQQEGNQLLQLTYVAMPPSEFNPVQGVSANVIGIRAGENLTLHDAHVRARDLLNLYSDGKLSLSSNITTHSHANGTYQTLESTTLECTEGPLTAIGRKGFLLAGSTLRALLTLVAGSTEGNTDIQDMQLKRIDQHTEKKRTGLCGSKTTHTIQETTTSVPSILESQAKNTKVISGKDDTTTITGSYLKALEAIIFEGKKVETRAGVGINSTTVTMEKESAFSSSSSHSFQQTANLYPTVIDGKIVYTNTKEANYYGTDFIADVLYDNTEKGALFGYTLATLKYFHQIISESPLAKSDVGCKGWYEVMQPCRLAVNKIIRMLDEGKIKLASKAAIRLTIADDKIERFVHPMPGTDNACGFYALLTGQPGFDATKNPRQFAVQKLQEGLKNPVLQPQICTLLAPEIREFLIRGALNFMPQAQITLNNSMKTQDKLNKAVRRANTAFGLEGKTAEDILAYTQETLIAAGGNPKHLANLQKYVREAFNKLKVAEAEEIAFAHDLKTASAFINHVVGRPNWRLGYGNALGGDEKPSGVMEAICTTLGTNLKIYQKNEETGQIEVKHDKAFFPHASTLELLYDPYGLGHFDRLEPLPLERDPTEQDLVVPNAQEPTKEDEGVIKLDSVIWDKNRTEIIGKFAETTYELKRWHTEWAHHTQVIPNEALVVVALAVSVVTYGAGTGAFLASSCGLKLGATGIAMANGGVAALFSSAASSFGRTGDPIATAKEVFSPSNLKALGISIASAGICSELGNALKIEMNPGLKAATDLKYQPSLLDFAKANALNTAVTVPLNVAIGGEEPGEAILRGVKMGAVNTIGQYAAFQIGNAYRGGKTSEPSNRSTADSRTPEHKVSEGKIPENPTSSPKMSYMAHKGMHGVVGGITGWALNPTQKGFTSGVIGAITAEVTSEALFSDSQGIADAVVEKLKKKETPLTKENVDKAINKEIQHRSDIARITAGGVAALTGQDASTAFATGTNAVENNSAVKAVIDVGRLVWGALGTGSLMVASDMAKDKMEVSSKEKQQDTVNSGISGGSPDPDWEPEDDQDKKGKYEKNKLKELKKAQEKYARKKELPDGRIRYYTKESPAQNPGPTRGRSHVTEHNPKTGQVRSWEENYTQEGTVNRVHPKRIDGQKINRPHYPPTAREMAGE